MFIKIIFTIITNTFVKHFVVDVTYYSKGRGGEILG